MENLKTSKLRYLLKKATVTAELSHDDSRKVGALLIAPNSGATLSEGFNGYVRGAPDDKLPKTRPEKYQYIMHAEANLITNAARHGVKTEGAILIVTLSPCTHCLRLCWQAGIDTIYFPKSEIYNDFYNSINMGDLNVIVAEVDEFIKLSLKRVQ
jgi:dCMP deaminase